jgi:hypothetical protein
MDSFFKVFFGVLMKTAILSLLFLLISQNNSFAKTLVISDVDDTIKITDVLGTKTHVFFNGVFRTRSFSGMSELYEKFSQNGDVIHYVSGSPKIISSRVENFLEENHFPQKYNLTLKDGLHDDTFHYKVHTIRELIKSENPDKVILIGDDTEHDPEIYDLISKENPAITRSIYIRAVQNRELPANVLIRNFFAAPELAAFEVTRGTMDVDSLGTVAKAFIYSWGESDISIKDRYCPKEGRAGIGEMISASTDDKFTAILEKVQEKIVSSCR